jgi:type IV pilus assembly protein PilO
MSLRLEKKQIIILLISAFLAVLLYFGALFLYLNPLKTSLSLKESQLKSEQQLGEALETRLASGKNSDFSSTAEMQKMLPVDPMIEQFVLDLEKAEIVSDSYMTSIEFTDGEQSSLAAQIDANQEVSSSEAVQSAKPEDPEATTNVEQKVSLNLPEGLAKTAAIIVVKADNYFDLEKFIETLENSKRIVMVESIAFSGPEEMVSLSDEHAQLEMTLTVNIFYLPGLVDLKEYNPKVETPAPANKRNPFPSFGDYSDENLTKDQNTQVEDEMESDESITEEESNEQ